MKKNNEWNDGVPAYIADEFRCKESEYCICVFVINEGKRLLEQLDRMAAFVGVVDVVIADGGSSDASTSAVVLKKKQVNTLLTKQARGKLGSQMRMAFHWALARGYKGVLVVDGNNKDGVDAIPRFISLLEHGYDFVQGSRFVEGGYHENTPLTRLLGVKLVHSPLISLAAGFRYTDTTNGFRAYSPRLLSDRSIGIFRNFFEGYELHYYLAVEAARRNYRCIETAVSRIYPDKGPIPTKISPIAGNFQVLLRLAMVVAGCYRPRSAS